MEKELITRYGILLITLLIVVLILLSLLAGNSFNRGAEKNAAPAMAAQNYLLPGDMASSAGGTLLVAEGSVYTEEFSSFDIINFEPARLDDHAFMRSLKKAAKPLVIMDRDPSLEARVWMMLSQLGIRELYVFIEDSTETLLKHECRPDTLVSK